MAGNSMLFVLKETKVANWTQDSLYSFQTGLFRGFQIGDPSRDKTVAIEAFDTQDVELKIWISARGSQTTRLSQSDINRILNSLRHTISGVQHQLVGF